MKQCRTQLNMICIIQHNHIHTPIKTPLLAGFFLFINLQNHIILYTKTAMIKNLITQLWPKLNNNIDPMNRDDNFAGIAAIPVTPRTSILLFETADGKKTYDTIGRKIAINKCENFQHHILPWLLNIREHIEIPIHIEGMVYNYFAYEQIGYTHVGDIITFDKSPIDSNPFEQAYFLFENHQGTRRATFRNPTNTRYYSPANLLAVTQWLNNKCELNDIPNLTKKIQPRSKVRNGDNIIEIDFSKK